MKRSNHVPLPQKQVYTSEDYWNLPEGQRTELIDGKLYAMAPPNRIHQELVMELSATIRQHIKDRRGDCKVYPSPFAVNLTANDKVWVEPDISVICDSSKLDDKGCHGAPDWVIEIISPGNKEMDYFKKLFKYQAAGVREYWIVDPIKEMVMVYRFEKETMEEYSFGEDIPVGIYEGFSIKVQ